MRINVILALLLMLHPASSAEIAAYDAMVFRDPRAFVPRLIIQKGEQVEPKNSIQNAMLVIHWSPPPKGETECYQISGVEGFHSRERVERFIKDFHALPREGEEVPPLLVAGNNWGAGSELISHLRDLSKTHGFDIYLWSDRAFTQASLLPEPADRLAKIRKAFGTP